MSDTLVGCVAKRGGDSHETSNKDIMQQSCATWHETRKAMAVFTFSPGVSEEIYTWSINNGMVEGHVTKLKLIKRQMYGKAGFALLRQRVLHAV
ncbi:MAG TPA: hypothetical protein VH164_02525 [Ktedonobacteraceae bacterium]|nr:hypothetical protein [Ktedonobacteraceae bacterium]